jgi:hypothetical protein
MKSYYRSALLLQSVTVIVMALVSDPRRTGVELADVHGHSDFD